MKRTADNSRNFPHSDEAERSVLSACMLNDGALKEAVASLGSADFFNGLHRSMFIAMTRLRDRGVDVNPWTLAEELKGESAVADVASTAFLFDMTRGVHSLFSITDACSIVKRRKVERRLLAALEGAGEKLQEGIEPTETIAERLVNDVAALRESTDVRASLVSIAQLASEAAPLIHRLHAGKTMLGVSTGMSRLDDCLPGWVAGELVLLAARPSCGKSALAGEFALRQAKAGNAVAIFSLEMGAMLFVLRLACREAGVNLSTVLQGFSVKDDWEKLVAALSQIAELPIWIDDTAGLTIQQLCSRVATAAREHKTRFVVVDYLQLLQADGHNRFEKVTAISQAMKNIAREIGKVSDGTVLALSQLNRIAVEEEPDLQHLRESGQLEQDADVVLMLFDEPDSPKQGPEQRKILKIAKQRNGPLGKVPLIFTRSMSFEQGTPRGWPTE